MTEDVMKMWYNFYDSAYSATLAANPHMSREAIEQLAELTADMAMKDNWATIRKSLSGELV